MSHPTIQLAEIIDAAMDRIAGRMEAAMGQIADRMEAAELAAAGIEPMVGIDQWAGILACSRREVERMRSAGKLPPPDLAIGRSPRWKASTARAWLDDQARASGRGARR